MEVRRVDGLEQDAVVSLVDIGLLKADSVRVEAEEGALVALGELDVVDELDGLSDDSRLGADDDRRSGFAEDLG